MKNPLRNDSDTVEYKSTKRKKPSESSTKYSHRQIPWEEQKRLGPRFKEAGKGNWPAHAIIQERKIGNKIEYLVEWEQHPETGEEFEPTWVCTLRHLKSYNG